MLKRQLVDDWDYINREKKVCYFERVLPRSDVGHEIYPNSSWSFRESPMYDGSLQTTLRGGPRIPLTRQRCKPCLSLADRGGKSAAYLCSKE
jgi:hypothetical protein